MDHSQIYEKTIPRTDHRKYMYFNFIMDCILLKFSEKFIFQILQVALAGHLYFHLYHYWLPSQPEPAILSILLSLTPDNFIHQWGTPGSQWVNHSPPALHRNFIIIICCLCYSQAYLMHLVFIYFFVTQKCFTVKLKIQNTFLEKTMKIESPVGWFSCLNIRLLHEKSWVQTLATITLRVLK